MFKRIKEMGLNATEDGLMIDVTGDNAKLLELKAILDTEGYKNDTKEMQLFGIPAPEDDEVNRILINYTCGVNGYLLVA